MGLCRHDFMDTWILPIPILTVTFNRAAEKIKTAATLPKGTTEKEKYGKKNPNKPKPNKIERSLCQTVPKASIACGKAFSTKL